MTHSSRLQLFIRGLACARSGHAGGEDLHVNDRAVRCSDGNKPGAAVGAGCFRLCDFSEEPAVSRHLLNQMESATQVWGESRPGSRDSTCKGPEAGAPRQE